MRGAFECPLEIAGPAILVRVMLAQPSRPAVYGPVRTVVWQGSAGDRRPYADHWRSVRGLLCDAVLLAIQVAVLRTVSRGLDGKAQVLHRFVRPPFVHALVVIAKSCIRILDVEALPAFQASPPHRPYSPQRIWNVEHPSRRRRPFRVMPHL